jgi:hypothetical protein
VLMWLMLDSWISSQSGNWSKLGSVVCAQCHVTPASHLFRQVLLQKHRCWIRSLCICGKGHGKCLKKGKYDVWIAFSSTIITGLLVDSKDFPYSSNLVPSSWKSKGHFGMFRNVLVQRRWSTIILSEFGKRMLKLPHDSLSLMQVFNSIHLDTLKNFTWRKNAVLEVLVVQPRLG